MSDVSCLGMSLDWLGKVVSAFDGDDDQDDDDSYEQSGNTQPQSSAYGQTDIKVAVKLEPNVDNAYTFDVHTPACVNTPAEAAAAPCTSSVGQSFLLPPFKLATHNVVAAAQVTCHVDAREFATCTGNTIVNDTRSCVEKQVRRPTAHVKVCVICARLHFAFTGVHIRQDDCLRLSHTAGGVYYVATSGARRTTHDASCASRSRTPCTHVQLSRV
jgi:hypothetical protein